jgi:hypothetical protein
MLPPSVLIRRAKCPNFRRIRHVVGTIALILIFIVGVGVANRDKAIGFYANPMEQTAECGCADVSDAIRIMDVSCAIKLREATPNCLHICSDKSVSEIWKRHIDAGRQPCAPEVGFDSPGMIHGQKVVAFNEEKVGPKFIEDGVGGAGINASYPNDNWVVRRNLVHEPYVLNSEFWPMAREKFVSSKLELANARAIESSGSNAQSDSCNGEDARKRPRSFLSRSLDWYHVGRLQLGRQEKGAVRCRSGPLRPLGLLIKGPARGRPKWGDFHEGPCRNVPRRNEPTTRR